MTRKGIATVFAALIFVAAFSVACSTGAKQQEHQPNELEEALASGKPTLAGFVGDDCCQDIRPELIELAAEYEGKSNILILDAAEQKELFSEYRITLTPTQIYFDASGNELERRTGHSSAQEMRDSLAAAGLQVSSNE